MRTTSLAASAHIFEHHFRVLPEDIDVQNHASNISYLKWVQDAAVSHWRHRATLEQQEAFTWVVIRHEIDYLRPAFLGQELLAKTWIGNATAATCERFTEIWRPSDHCLLAKAHSVWCLLDRQSFRPRRITQDLVERFT
ncbi:MAG: thioesterase family protein [Chloroherpetonaceae bacterium]|nr:acyl-CoA thioesterase [Chloroherpetonaceae bacterium]MCS7211814.1 acyl-CoA thioesterase [Chloroherpetonaceae bacterium]MDW8018595.1 thioesterase family protein [Chloroherpetonaceae bacterium]MDW8467301.1 thioesterase family protein [Chloroherpetonaceae bacterium]